jgi:hypothetical protein
MLELDTPHGRHGCTCTIRPAEPRGALVLDHGAVGVVGARDLVVATEVATGRRLTVALVEQPYRVTGRRSTPAAHLLDQA